MLGTLPTLVSGWHTPRGNGCATGPTRLRPVESNGIRAPVSRPSALDPGLVAGPGVDADHRSDGQGEALVALVVSVVYRDLAIPVAGRPTRSLDAVAHVTLRMLCDRGLQSPDLWAGRAFRERKRRGTLIVLWVPRTDNPLGCAHGRSPRPRGPRSLRGVRVDRTGIPYVQAQGLVVAPDPAHGPRDRHGRVLAVATLWVLAYGTRVEESRLRGLAPGCVQRPPLPPQSPRPDP